MSLCHTAALNAWDKIQEPGKRTEPYTEVIQGPKELVSEFVQRLTKAVQLGVPDPDATQVLIESLAFENANLEHKKVLGS